MNAETIIRPSLIGALAKALAEIEGVQKNKNNPGLKGARYADLSAVIDAIEPVKAHGLWYRQQSKRDPEGALVETFYIHESGEELSAGETFVPANKKDPQGFGSALTYCRRYALMTAFGLAAEDDDGHAATQSVRSQRRDEPREEPRPQDEPQGMPDAEWAKLVQMAKASGTSSDELVRNFKVKNLRLLNQQQYAAALELMNDRMAEKAKADTAAKAGNGFDLDDEIPF